MRSFILVGIFFILGSCANRGYTVSQQIPRYDNNLNLLDAQLSYKVDQAGEIHVIEAQKNDSKNQGEAERYIASQQKIVQMYPISQASLDLENGGLFLGKSSVQAASSIKSTKADEMTPQLP